MHTRTQTIFIFFPLEDTFEAEALDALENCITDVRSCKIDVIVYIFAHLHTTLCTEGNMLDTN